MYTGTKNLIKKELIWENWEWKLSWLTNFNKWLLTWKIAVLNIINKCNYLRSLSLGFFYYYLHQSWDINIHKYVLWTRTNNVFSFSHISIQYKVSQLFFYRYRCRGTNGFGSAEYTYQISFRGENAAQEGILARAFKGTVLREKGLRETMDRKPDT